MSTRKDGIQWKDLQTQHRVTTIQGNWQGAQQDTRVTRAAKHGLGDSINKKEEIMRTDKDIK
jgi:hypothetical protein